MYSSLLFFHSLFRWLVLAALLWAIFRAYKGDISRHNFTKIDNALRHWTATIAHIQLMIGFSLYFTSPVISYFFRHFKEAIHSIDTAFFGIIHIVLMFTSVVIITIGSALTKRKPTDREKFRTMWVWFLVALVLIFMAIPWPFSPLANRPYLRTI